MNVTPSTDAADIPAPPPVVIPPMPIAWRAGLFAAFLGLTTGTYFGQASLGGRGQALIGIVAFFVLAMAASANLKHVNWRTILGGILLQVVLALAVLQVPAVKAALDATGNAVKKFIGFSDKGAEFVFGNISDPRPPQFGGTWSRLFPGEDSYQFQFAFVALPPILFVSAFFTVLYHYGVLQILVRMLAKVMTYVMGTSGAETLSVSANVFMGQTEAPLIVKPYVPRMTNSELFALMVSGMAHISGGMMAVYINYGADPAAVITTCVMACPCSLYLAKLVLPELGTPETSGTMTMDSGPSPYANAVDAAAAGTKDGLQLALNVAAMLIVFIAFVAMFDALLGLIKPGLLTIGLSKETLANWPDDLSLKTVFGWLFSPVAMLMGVEGEVDQSKVGSLLGIKLSINEHVAYLTAKKQALLDLKDAEGVVTKIGSMSKRSQQLAAFALTGFANFASIGIQLGGIGAMAPNRRKDLARLGGKALFIGFLATLLNAAVAGVLMNRE